MRLSDIMSQMGLASYAEIALLIFLFVFVAVAVRVLFISKSHELDHAASLPLENDEPSARRSER